MIAPPRAGNVIGSVDASFVVAEWKDAGGSPGPPRWIAPLHLHHNDNHDENWYVLEGAMCVRVGKDVVEARSGSAVFVPHGHGSSVLESGSRTSAIWTGDDLENLCADPGNSRDEGPVFRGVTRGV
jgi:mannose-6-phosphate isomerase-like protein (cupin superfamily)